MHQHSSATTWQLRTLCTMPGLQVGEAEASAKVAADKAAGLRSTEQELLQQQLSLVQQQQSDRNKEEQLRRRVSHTTGEGRSHIWRCK